MQAIFICSVLLAVPLPSRLIDKAAGMGNLCSLIKNGHDNMSDLAKAKFNMIEQQIRPWEVLDPQVLDVFHQLDRDRFVPEQYKGLAYADCQLPVCKGETMLPPIVEGRMLQALKLQPGDSVLQIGTAGGYVTACLATLTQQVLGVDFQVEATELTRDNLSTQGIHNVELHTIASLDDIIHKERYDVIAVCTGSLHEIPDNLEQALAIGGRLFAVTGHSPAKHAQLMTRVSQTEWVVDNLFETDIPDLAHL